MAKPLPKKSANKEKSQIQLLKIEQEIQPLQTGRIQVATTGLNLMNTIEFEEWEKIGRTLKLFNRSNLWWLADWLNFGERKFGEMYSQALEGTDYDYQTLRHIKATAEKVEMCRRRHNLSFSHHIEVKALEPKDQDKYLKLADEKGWTIAELRGAIKGKGLKHECKEWRKETVEVCLECGKIKK